LEEVAEKIGVTRSHLSQVERGKVNPSVNTLWSLADALDTPVGLLFKAKRQKSPHLGLVRVEFISDGVKCLSLSPQGREGFEFTYIEYAPGSSTGEQLGKHRGMECVLVIEGTIRFMLGGKEYVLTKEQSIQFRGNIPHGVQNTTNKKAAVIYAVYPEIKDSIDT